MAKFSYICLVICALSGFGQVDPLMEFNLTTTSYLYGNYYDLPGDGDGCHTGVDYGYPRGTPLESLSFGQIAFRFDMTHDVSCNPNTCDYQPDHGMGRVVDIAYLLENGSLIFASYNHQNRIHDLSRFEEWFTKKQFIGYVGGSGQNSDNYWTDHLHLETRIAANTLTENNHIVSPWGYTSGSNQTQCEDMELWNPNRFGYRDPQLYIDHERVLFPFLSRSNPQPDEDDYDVYGVEGETLYGLMRANGSFYHAAILARSTTERRNYETTSLSAQPKYLAQEGQENTQTDIITVNGLIGNTDEYPAGDYLFLPTVAVQNNQQAYERRYGYPIKFHVLDDEASSIVDNDQHNAGGYQYNDEIYGTTNTIPGYFTSAHVVERRSNSWAQWKPGASGRYRIYVHIPKEVSAEKLVYRIKEDGETTIESHPVNNFEDTVDRWVLLTGPEGSLFNFTEEGYVGLFLGTDIDKPSENARPNSEVAFDAVKFEAVNGISGIIGHYLRGWRERALSRLFLEAYNENGGFSAVGVPDDDDNGPYIHWLSPTGDNPGLGIWLQNFVDSGSGQRASTEKSALIYSPEQNKVYWVKGAFWNYYKAHHGYRNLGAPRKNEFVRNGKVFQLFEKAMLKWDPVLDEVTVHRRLDSPPIPKVEVDIQSETPVRIYNNDVMIGMTPLRFESCERCIYEMEAELTAFAGGNNRQTFQFTADPDNPVVHIEAEPPSETVTLSGNISRADGYPVWDVVLFGLAGNPKTDHHGAFSVVVPRGWSGTLTPEKQYYSFAEPSLTITNAQTDIGDIHFTGTKLRPSIPLRVTLDGVGLEGVRLSGLSGNAYTDSNGDYLAQLHVGWEGAIRPRLTGYRFTPASLAVDYLEEDLAPVVFTATERTSIISGRIELHGQPLAGVVMQGLPGDPLTDSDGYYEATVPYAWSGQVTPVLEGRVLAPENRIYQEVISSKYDEDYLALLQGHTVSGRVTESGSGLADAWLTGLPAGVLSDGAGNYSALVNHGWSQTVTPLKLGYQFNPANVSLPPVTSDQADVNFAGSLLPGERRIWMVTTVPEFDQATVFADPGDIIYVRPGVYDEPRLRSLHDGVTLISEAGAAQTTITLNYYNLNQDNTTFDGFTFQGLTATETLHLNNVSNVLIRNCIFKPGGGDFAIRIHESENVIIEGNIIGDAASRGILLRAGNGGGSITVRNNVFPQTPRPIDGGGNPDFRLTVHNNLFDGNSRTVDLYDVASFLFHNNILVNNTSEGINLGDLGSTAQIYQNTFVDNETATEIGTHALMYNNLFKDNNRHIDGSGSNTNITIHHTFHWPGGLLYCCANFIVDWGTTLQLDPRFVDQAGGDYHLLESSPAIEAGAGGHDLGAYGGDHGDAWTAVPGAPQALPALLDFQINGPVETGTGGTVPMLAKAFYQPNYYSWVQHLATWNSSDPSVLEHQGHGRFLAHAPGTAVITAGFGGLTREFTVEVLNATLDAAMESVQLDPGSRGAGDPLLMLFINYANNGDGGAANVRLAAEYDPAFNFISAVPAPDTGSETEWSLPNLQPGESGTIAVTGSIPADLGNDIELISDVEVMADFSSGVQVQEITQIPGVPELAIQVDAQGLVVPGGSNLVTVTLINSGTATAQNAVLHAAYDPRVRFLAASPSPGSENNDWDIGFLSSGGQTSIVLELTTDPFLEPGLVLENLFTFSADYVANAAALQLTTTEAPVADLDVVQFSDQAYALPGEPLTFWALVTNRGPSTASDLVLTDTFTQGTAILQASHAFTLDDDEAAMALGNLEPGASLTVLMTVAAPEGASLDATAQISALEADPDPDNNVSPTTVPIAYAPEGVIDSPAGNVAIITGDPVSFAGTGSDPDGQTPLSFRWDFGGAAPAATEEDPGEVIFSVPGTYTITFSVTDNLGIEDPTPATRTVTVRDNQAPAGTIDTPAQNAVVCRGETLYFSATGIDPDGHDPLTYAWDFDGAAPNATIEDPGEVTFDQVGTFTITLLVTDARDLDDPTPATIDVTVLDPVDIAAHPQPATRCVGESVTLNVAADGSGPVTYQWRRNGTEIPGATSPELTMVTTVEDAGSYDCQVSNDCGNLLTQAALLTVDEAVAVTGHPLPTAACPGSRVVLTVTVSGSPPFSYQWRKNGADLGGATGASLVLDPVAAGDGGTYDCLVTNACGSAASHTALLRIDEPATVTASPVDQDVCHGDEAIFTVSAQGTGPFAYQWRKDGADIPGATAATLNVAAVAPTDGGSYACVITNPCGTVVSGDAILAVNSPVAITQQPQPAEPCLGDDIELILSADGTGPLTYQWRKDGEAIAGATTASLSLTGLTAAAAGSYDCRVTNICGSVLSDPVDLALGDAPAIDGQPGDAWACPDEVVTLSVQAVGSEPFTYQWRRDGVEIAGATEPELSVTAVEDVTYDCLVSNHCGSVITRQAQLVVGDPVDIGVHPQAALTCPEETAAFVVSASGSPPLSYQWRRDGIPIDGENTPELIVPMVTLDDAGLYDCVVTNDCGSVASQAAALTVEGDLQAAVFPPGNAQGLDPLILEALVYCAVPGFSWQWRNLNTGEIFGQNQNPVTLPFLDETTDIELEVSDGDSQAIATARVLVAAAYADLNGDGCNNLADLYLLIADWLRIMPQADDPNGDGIIDVRDFLYINTQGQNPCP